MAPDRSTARRHVDLLLPILSQDRLFSHGLTHKGRVVARSAGVLHDTTVVESVLPG